MNNFVITIDPTVTGFWGWNFVLGSIVLFLLAVAVWRWSTWGNKKRSSEIAGWMTLAAFIAVVLGGLGAASTYPGVEAQTERARIWTELWTTEGFTVVDSGPSGTYYLGRDGNIAQYAVVQTSSNDFQFTQISE